MRLREARIVRMTDVATNTTYWPPALAIGRISEDRIWLDLRGADPIDELINNIQQLTP